MANLDKYLVNPKKFSLSDFRTDDKSERSDSKEQDSYELTRLATEINALQDILHAEGNRKVLLIFGMDASGKDGTVRHVFSECDPLSIRLASFKTPSSDELAHDYLWRVHSQVRAQLNSKYIFMLD